MTYQEQIAQIQKATARIRESRKLLQQELALIDAKKAVQERLATK